MGYRSGSVVLARLVTSLLTGALRFIRRNVFRCAHYCLLNNMSRSAPMICCQSKKRTWLVKGWIHIQSVLSVEQVTYMCSVPLPFGNNLATRVERFGISVSTVSQSAMNQLWLLCHRAQSPTKSRKRCDESQQDLYHWSTDQSVLIRLSDVLGGSQTTSHQGKMAILESSVSMARRSYWSCTVMQSMRT